VLLLGLAARAREVASQASPISCFRLACQPFAIRLVMTSAKVPSASA